MSGTIATEFIIPATEGRAVVVKRGQTLRIHQTDGGQVGDCTFYNANDYKEIVHVGQSWALNVMAGTGTCKAFKHFYSKPPRENVMLTVTADTYPNHWGNMGGRCSNKIYEVRDDIPGGHRSCQQNLTEAVEPYGLTGDDVFDIFNVFMKVDLHSDGGFTIHPTEASPDDYIDLHAEVLAIAGAVLQAKPEALDLRDGEIVDAGDGRARMTLVELCEIAFYRQHELPPDIKPELVATRHFTNREPPYFVANGIQASYLEVDVKTGGITLLGHWAVEDCGRLVNPMLVDEQIRGGIVQGLGAALYENCIYSEDGQLLTGTLVDYLVPMAVELPDIVVAHLETPQAGTELGVKGAGEAGAEGSGAAVWCALNDALRPLGARVTRQPFTPETVLKALGTV